MLPSVIRVDVHAYNSGQLDLIRALPESSKILGVIENGLYIPREQFLVYALFRCRDVSNLERLRNLATAKEALLEEILSVNDTSFCAHPQLDATEHRAEAQDIGEALGLCLMDNVYNTNEQDWSRIPEGPGKSLDYVASDSKRILEVESKGSFVVDRSRKSSAISKHKADILKKKEVRRASQERPTGVHLGTISAIDRRPGGRPTLWIVDPPVGYQERAPEYVRLLHRMDFILGWLTLINPRSPLTVGLANRLLDLKHIQNPSVLDGIPLTGPLNKPILPSKDPFASHGRFFSTRSVVADGPAGGLIVPSGMNEIFFAGVREDLVDNVSSQDFSAISGYQMTPTTLEKTVTGIISQGRFQKYGFKERSEEVVKRGTGYFALKLRGALHYSAGGLVFGWLPRPSDL